MIHLPQWLLNAPIAERRAMLVLDPGAGRRESLGSAIRGATGHRTLEALCERSHRTCRGCDLQAQCPHAMLYAPAGDGDPSAPWWLRLVDAGPRIEVAFRTIGDHADELADVLVRAFGEQVVGGKLEGAATLSYGDGPWTPARPLSSWLAPMVEGARDLLVVLESPLELKVNKEILRTAPSLRTILAAIARRADTLVQQWCPPLFATDRALGRELLELADHIRCEPLAVGVHEVGRFSNQQERQMEFPGLVGALRFEAVPPELAAWLRVGEVLGVGRHTAFGFGAISVWDGSAEGGR